MKDLVYFILKDEQLMPEDEQTMLSNCGAGEDFWEPFRLQGDQTSQSERK